MNQAERESFLRATDVIDFQSDIVRSFLAGKAWADLPEIERVERAFLYVRDEIPHSWDAQHQRVTCTASQVLEHRTGICYAKSHLLAALLRGMNMPAGLCYQRLVLFDDPADGYSVHAFNAAYIESAGRWVRFDARGNKRGVDAQFSLGEEKLAFAVRPDLGEIDYGVVLADPPRVIVESLRRSENVSELYTSSLPSFLADI